MNPTRREFDVFFAVLFVAALLWAWGYVFGVEAAIELLCDILEEVFS